MDQNLKENNRRRILSYNKQRYLELLKLKYLSEKDLSCEDSRELSEYSLLLDSQVSWETSDQYLQLIDELIQGKISTSEFFSEFDEINQRNGEVFDLLESNFVLLSVDEKSLDFSNFIVELTDCLQSYRADSELDMPNEEAYTRNFKLMEAYYLDLIEETYMKFQQAFSEK